jgi:hypothetical protein
MNRHEQLGIVVQNDRSNVDFTGLEKMHVSVKITGEAFYGISVAKKQKNLLMPIIFHGMIMSVGRLSMGKLST